MTDVREIDRIEDLAPLREAWHRLLGETADASFFHTLEWLETYWKHFGQGRKLRVLVVSDAGRPIGILPLVVLLERRKIVPVRVLTYPLDDWGGQYGPMGPRPAAVLDAGLDYLRQRRRDWDLLDLRWAAKGGPAFLATDRAMRGAHLKVYPTVRATTAQIELTGTYDDYLASRTSKWRNNHRRCRQRIARHGELSLERHCPDVSDGADGAVRWDLYDTCVELAEASWQGSSTTGTTLSHESVRAFLRDCHAAAAALGMADVNVLRLGGRPVAFAYNYRWRDRVFGLRLGYRPELAKAGIGNLLFASIIEDSCRRGDRLYDMGPGSLAAKKGLLTRTVDLWQFTHFPPMALRGQLVRLKHLAREYTRIGRRRIRHRRPVAVP